jgi:predicted ester cyclase
MTRLIASVCSLCFLQLTACAGGDDKDSDLAASEVETARPDAAAPAAASDAGEDVADVDAGAEQDPVVAAHIDVIRQRIAANNARDWDTWQSLHTEGAVRTAPGLPAPVEGSEAMRDRIEELFTSFPDYHLELVEAFGAGDRLVARIHTRATMSGPLQLGELTAPATGKSFEQDWVVLLQFEGNKISAIDEFYDNYEILVQLGLSL